MPYCLHKTCLETKSLIIIIKMKPLISFPFLLPLLLLLFITNASSSSADSNSVYETFLNCFTSRTRPSDKVSNLVYEQTNTSYATVLQNYIRNRRFNTSSTPKPLIIVTPTVESHVQAAVVCARDNGMHMKIRSGGHDYEGISYVSNDPFFVLDMFNIKSIDVNIQDGTAWVEAGATLGELYYAIWKKSKVHGFPAGVGTTVGVGGHISGGGYGNMLRKYGLSVDNVLDAKIVDVKGRVLDRKSMGEDLFWAICGGGGASFGVVLAYKVKLVPVPETVTVFRMERLIENNATVLVSQWQSVASKIDNNLFMRMLIQPVNSPTKKGEKTVRITIVAQFLGNADTLVALLAKELPVLGLKKENCNETSWIQSVLWWDNFQIGTAPEAMLNRIPKSINFLKRKSDYVQTPISEAGLEALWQKMISLGKCGLVFNPYGGRMAEILASATPFPHRAGNLFKVQFSINWSEDDPQIEKDYLAEIRELYSFMAKFVSKNPRSAFLNYRDLDIGITTNGNNSFAEGKVYGVKYFNNNFARLVRVKTAVDPQNFFRNEQSIPVLPKKA